MHFQAPTVLVSAFALGAVLVQGAPPDVEFDCNTVPNVCANMCWGSWCSDFGDGEIGMTLTYDAPDPATTDRRYNDACGKVTCGDGDSCDEYPFKTTSDADIEDRYARCVPQTENSSQGGTLGNYYKKITGGTQFTYVVGNPGAATPGWCEYPPDCTNDGKEFRNGALADKPTKPPTKRAVKMPKREVKRHYYRASNGDEILSFKEMEIGRRMLKARHNETRAAENVKLGKRDPESEYDLEDNFITAYLRSE